MRQNRKESKSIPKAAAKAKPHMEKRKKRNQKPEQREEIKATEEKKKKKKWILTLTSVTCVLKLELSHLMRETSCPSFIGGA